MQVAGVRLESHELPSPSLAWRRCYGACLIGWRCRQGGTTQQQMSGVRGLSAAEEGDAARVRQRRDATGAQQKSGAGRLDNGGLKSRSDGPRSGLRSFFIFLKNIFGVD
jgi:hypothetical protein